MRYLHARNRAILREMISTDFKIRYQGSVLGYLWSLLKPLFLFTIIYVVFTYVIPLGKGVEHFSVYLIIGIVLWNFFNEATTIGASSVVGKGDLIRKISIPRYLAVVASSVSALINLGLSLIIVFLFALFNGIMPSLQWLLIIPLALELFVFAIGISFFLSAAYVKYRDITYIWEVVLQAGFYASAIIYPLTKVPVEYQKWFFLNPIVQIIQDARYAIATKQSITIWSATHFPYVLIPFVIIAVVVFIGWRYFKKKSITFAEDI
jgi:ABC-2 type transport system permease protein